MDTALQQRMLQVLTPRYQCTTEPSSIAHMNGLPGLPCVFIAPQWRPVRNDLVTVVVAPGWVQMYTLPGPINYNDWRPCGERVSYTSVDSLELAVDRLVQVPRGMWGAPAPSDAPRDRPTADSAYDTDPVQEDEDDRGADDADLPGAVYAGDVEQLTACNDQLFHVVSTLHDLHAGYGGDASMQRALTAVETPLYEAGAALKALLARYDEHGLRQDDPLPRWQVSVLFTLNAASPTLAQSRVSHEVAKITGPLFDDERQRIVVHISMAKPFDASR